MITQTISVINLCFFYFGLKANEIKKQTVDAHVCALHYNKMANDFKSEKRILSLILQYIHSITLLHQQKSHKNDKNEKFK